MTNLELYIDGASKGNPGHSGIGVAVLKDGIPVKEIGWYIGETTNNIAEYQALLRGLEEARALRVEELKIYSDSQLLCRQMTGDYKVRHPGIVPLYREAVRRLRAFRSVSIINIPREQNKLADKLATQAVKEFLSDRKSKIIRDREVAAI